MTGAILAFVLSFSLPLALKASTGAEKCEFYLNPRQPIIDDLLRQHDQTLRQVIAPKKLLFFGLPAVTAFTAPVGVQGSSAEVNQVSLVENPVFQFEDDIVEPGPLSAVDGNLAFFGAEDISTYFSPRAQVGGSGLKEPFLSVVGDQIIFGGTRYVSAIEMAPQISIFRSTVRNPTKWKYVTTSAIGMRNLRLQKLPNGKIHAVVQRSGTSEYDGGLGRNAFVNLNSLDDLDELKLLSARMNRFQVGPGEGISTTHIEPMGDDIAYLANVFRRDPQNPEHQQSYVAVYSKLDPNPQIILRRQDIEDEKNWRTNDAKYTDHIAAEGIVRNFDGTATLYLTAGKSEAWKVTIADPFLRFAQ